MSFKGKVVVVTGAAGEIGKETVKLFAEKGAKLVLVDLDAENLKKTAFDLALQKDKYLIVKADVTKEEDVQKYVEESKIRFGKIDVFFNNAGVIGKLANLTEQEASNLDLVLNVNVKGVFYGLKHVLKVMIDQQDGSIINMSSVAGLAGSPGLSPYVASKHAVIGLTKTAALEVASKGVRINAVCPDPVNTKMAKEVEKWLAPEDSSKNQKEKYTSTLPLKRYAEPKEIAELVMFLASNKASYINGSCYTIDGGTTAG
ncbi:SDR family oxidoreductase [Bacillus sp. FJAT-29790]|uniref:SDR family NAD(P)-dependent oxidoreductase n=1 Tax=Bacillus sp. FJAT-29790 TaxID=1895002 RepID=UPI001C239DF4|nr:SDR family oxidoreductase [Bacillus sp. FJAT-29790]